MATFSKQKRTGSTALLDVASPKSPVVAPKGGPSPWKTHLDSKTQNCDTVRNVLRKVEPRRKRF